MNQLEIERKFLVKDMSFIEKSYQKTIFKQGYLNTHKERTVRIRIANKNAFITIKGKSNNSGTSRYEWEKEIDLKEGEQLLNLCEPGMISKTRYLIKSGIHTYEVDVFEENNKGLIVAEIELNNENETFIKPDWLGEEVTGQKKYYNSQLTIKPYNQW